MSIRIEDLLDTDFSDIADLSGGRTAPIHPGEILLEEFLKPLNVSQYALAKAIGVPPRRINEIVHSKRGITVDTAMRLARFFGTDAQSWINLQTHYDATIAEEKMRDVLMRIPRFSGMPQDGHGHNVPAMA
jgi:addiction module HigA family antidote